MYAVVKTGGKQVKLEKGMTEVVEKLDTPVGGTVTFTPLFVSDDGKALVGGDVAGVTVTAEVVEHFKGDKQLVFKFKKRKGYKKLKGHRQAQTRIRVTEIVFGEAPKKAAAKKTAEKATKTAKAPVEAAAVVETPVEAPAKKPAARKPAAPKKEPAAKKPAAKKPAAPKAKAEAKTAEAGEEKPKRTRKPAAKKETPTEPAESE